MVWGAFSSLGVCELAILTTRVNAEKYCEVLDNYIVPFVGKHVQHGLYSEFQQDNASVHTAKLTRSWFRFNFIRVMEWPARSPDLNPIENLWGYMARKVYGDCTQYRKGDELQKSILKVWSEIPVSYMNKLIKSMPKRCVTVLETKGGKTKY